MGGGVSNLWRTFLGGGKTFVTARDKGERGKIVKKMRDILYGQPQNSKYNISSAGKNREKNKNLAIFSRPRGSNIDLKIWTFVVIIFLVLGTPI